VLCERYRTTGGIKQMETHNRSENGCGAWVTLCAQPLILILSDGSFGGGGGSVPPEIIQWVTEPQETHIVSADVTQYSDLSLYIISSSLDLKYHKVVRKDTVPSPCL
jgi:hypothetical protein